MNEYEQSKLPQISKDRNLHNQTQSQMSPQLNQLPQIDRSFTYKKIDTEYTTNCQLSMSGLPTQLSSGL